jgi:hypothetical protein
MLPAPTAQKLYEQLAPHRDHFLRQAQRCAELTIPFLFPPDGASDATVYSTPYQGVGARGVNNLASKLLIALLPPNSPFFRLVVDPFELKKLADDPKMKTALDSALSEIERTVASEIETSAVRVAVFEALKHLIVGGNVLLHVPASGGVRAFHLSRFVVKRDPMGNVLTIVTKETVHPDTLPEAIQRALSAESEAPPESTERTLDVYTVIRRAKVGSGWEVYQEARGKRLPDTDGIYPADRCPWLPLRFSKVGSDDYGRGLVEETLGDLSSLEALSRALLEAAAAAAKVVFLVNPNGTTRIDALVKAPNGGFVSGTKEDVSTLQLEKFYDLRTVQEQAATLEKRLEQSFLLTSGATRQAERVTAEEVRAMVQELEATLGGVYSILAQELQLPLVNTLMDRMAKDKRLPTLPKGVVKPAIVTGLDALGRGNDLQKLDFFVRGMAEVLGPQVLTQYLDVADYLKRRAAALGMDIQGLIKSAEAVAEEQQAAQQAALAERLGPNAVNQAGQLIQAQQQAALNPPAEQ